MTVSTHGTSAGLLTVDPVLPKVASPELGAEPMRSLVEGKKCRTDMGYTPLPLRKMEKILMLPRRSVVKVRLAGVLLRPCRFFVEPLECPSADRSMTRTLPLSRDSCVGLWASFLFRAETSDIISATLVLGVGGSWNRAE